MTQLDKADGVKTEMLMAQDPLDRNNEREIRRCRLYSALYVVVVWSAYGLLAFGWPWWPFAFFAVLVVIAAVVHLGSALEQVAPYRWYGRGGLIACHLVLVGGWAVVQSSGSSRDIFLAAIVLGLPLLVLLHLAERLNETRS